MGRMLLVCRLAARDLRWRPVEAALMLLVITAATTTLTLGLALSGMTSHPYLDTRTATAGPDVVAQSSGPAKGGGSPVGRPARAPAPGVTGHRGPYPVASPALRANGHTVPAASGFVAEGRDSALPAT